MVQTHRKSAFTLIELLMAMILVSLISVACIWVFRQSLEISSIASSRAKINESFRKAQDKIRKDLVDCLPLDSRQQQFIMISRYADRPDFKKTLPKDYLSFATTTRVTDDLVSGFVSYDLVGTTLYRYVSDEFDWKNSKKMGYSSCEEWPSFHREIVVKNCVEFKVEYLWKDERDIEVNGAVATIPSTKDEYRHISGSGMFLSLHPWVNEDATGKNTLGTMYRTGGFNGSAVVKHVSDDAAETVVNHSGEATTVGAEFNTSAIFGINGSEILIPNPDDFSKSYSEPYQGKPGYARESYKEVEGLADKPSKPILDKASYNRIVFIRSPNLYRYHEGFSIAGNGGRTYDITANYPSADWTKDYVPGGNFFGAYLVANSGIKSEGTFVPAQLRITMKIHNDNHSVFSTHSFILNIPFSGR